MNGITLYESLGTISLEGCCKTFYARKKGKSHMANGTVCQDYCLAENIGDDIQVVCVADGHGGEAYTKSDKGSYYACSAFLELIKTIKSNCDKRNNTGTLIEVLRTKEFKKKYIQSWKQTVVEAYKKENNESTESAQAIVKKYGTTFLFTVVCRDALVIGQLGDGAIMLSNEFGQQQLFKRHAVKTTSATSSLASNRAEYSFVIDVYEKKYFSSVLLSTDGIYDKLDTDNSFSLYEQDLVKQIEEYGELKEPFMVKGIDVSDITKDDCSISLIRLADKAIPIVSPDVKGLEYENKRFVRYSKGLFVFEGEKEGKKYEIHIISRHNEKEAAGELKTARFIKAIQTLKINDEFCAFIYELHKDWHRVGELVDSGEHLEKRYWFNENELFPDDGSTTAGSYSNEYWLSFYEQILLLEDELLELKMSTKEYLNESLFVTADNEILILSDGLTTSNDEASCISIKRLLDRFSIIGKLICGKISIPLFETVTQGQNIAMLHVANEKRVLCKVIYNVEKKILGLWNVTSNPWNVESGKRKSIPSQGVIRLNKDQYFYVALEDVTINPDAEVVDGYAKYQVQMLRR